MKLMKKLMAGAAAALTMTVAQASMINVGGVNWDPDDGLDFSAATVSMRQLINPSTGIVSGFGIINTLNGNSAFCPGCQLTFTFSGFTPSSAGLLPGAVGSAINYTGGDVNVYVNHGPTTINPFNPLTLSMAAASTGTLWLGMSGNSAPGYSLLGSVIPSGLSGIGQLDVKSGAAGGLARSNFDTNEQTGGADLAFTISFSTFLNAGPDGIPGNGDDSTRPAATNKLNAVGGGNFYGNTIPEPGSLALLGLGLLGAAVARRRKA